MNLRFIRDTDNREIDFVVLKDGRPEFAVECKVNDQKTSSLFNYFRERTNIEKFYFVHLGSNDYGNEQTGQRVLPFKTFCRELGMP